MTDVSPFVVSADWLEAHLEDPGLSIVDASWYLPAQNRDARAEYEAAHIPRAVFFDHDDGRRPEFRPCRIRCPTPRTFARHAGAMGISADDTIVVYDGPGLFSAPRAWWMFRTMGVFQVYLLDGGFDSWKAAGRPSRRSRRRLRRMSSTPISMPRASLRCRRCARSLPAATCQSPTPGRPAASQAPPEPRPGVRGGHMPGARSLPASALMLDGKLLPADKLRERFAEAGIDLERPVVTSCGSGVTAAIITLALETLGHSANRLYDGSWTEWGSRSDTPVVTGKE